MGNKLSDERAVLAQIGRMAVRYVKSIREAELIQHTRWTDRGDESTTPDYTLVAMRDRNFRDLQRFVDGLPRKLVDRLLRPTR